MIFQSLFLPTKKQRMLPRLLKVLPQLHPGLRVQTCLSSSPPCLCACASTCDPSSTSLIGVHHSPRQNEVAQICRFCCFSSRSQNLREQSSQEAANRHLSLKDFLGQSSL